VPPAQVTGSAYDELPDGIITVDADGLISSVNRVAARMLSASPGELVGAEMPIAVPLVDPQGRDWWKCIDPFAGLPGRVRLPEQLLTITRPGVHERKVLVTAAFVRDESRSVRMVVISMRGTHARDQQERSGAELVSVVAHELRSPLTSVKGFTSTLLAKWDRFTDEQKVHMLRTVDADADRLTRLISELLDVSRIESGRLELRKQVVDLPELLRRDISGRIAAGESADRFDLEIRDALPELWADPDKVAQVIANIIENALRHGEGTVSVTVGVVDHRASVRVVDQGHGIAPEALPWIFTKFWHDRTRGGTGLGLFVAKGIVEAHGGTIQAGNASGGGASVMFELPAGTPTFMD